MSEIFSSHSRCKITCDLIKPIISVILIINIVCSIFHMEQPVCRQTSYWLFLSFFKALSPSNLRPSL
nr:MAG TPA: hypothetical protein [Caudoviricetes sp.]DAJ33243.1 MAG TPA: hypothetical protein [Herelleviridae sp.]